MTFEHVFVAVMLLITVGCVWGRWAWDHSRPETIEDGYSPSEHGLFR